MRESPLTADVLTRWLRLSGTLPRGSVDGLRPDLEIQSTTSRLTFLTVAYSRDAPLGLPRRLAVKSPLAGLGFDYDVVAEAQFYSRLAQEIEGLPLVRCLAAVADADAADAGTVVLEDLRATHEHPPGPRPPSRKQCELALSALARLHARWWESPALGREVGQPHTMEGLAGMVRGIAGRMPAFFDAAGGGLTDEDRRTYERVFGSPLRPWMRLTEPRALTVIHGDAHTGNFLFPRSGEGPAFLIDWQLWHVDVGARDLAFFMALYWSPDSRRELEAALARYYFDCLIASGVEGYSFDELWLDYRRCVVRNLTLPIIFWSHGMKPEDWRHRLECALAAYRDLACDELL